MYDNNYENNSFSSDINSNGNTADNSRRVQWYSVPPEYAEKINSNQNGPSKKSPKWIAGLIAGCMVLSFGCGLGGSYLGSYLQDSSSSPSSQLTNGSSTTATNTSSTSSSGSVADVVSKVADSVVALQTESVSYGSFMQQWVESGAGSGVILTEDGYIVTNNHVIDGASKIQVTLRNGETYEATLVGTDEESDIALLKIDANGLTPAVLGDSSTLQVGQKAIVIGNPLGSLGGTVTDGIVSALDRQIDLDGKTMNLLQTNAAVNPGNSGGGMFDENGQLIGLIVAKSTGTDVEGLGFAIPVNDVRDVVEQLMDYGYVKGRIDLEMTLVDITSTQEALMYRVDRLGTYVLKVPEGSNAEKAGFQVGDCITAVGSTAVSSSSDVTSALSQYQVGDSVDFTVVRDGQTLTLNLTLAEYNPS